MCEKKYLSSVTLVRKLNDTSRHEFAEKVCVYHRNALGHILAHYPRQQHAVHPLRARLLCSRSVLFQISFSGVDDYLLLEHAYTCGISTAEQ